MNKKGSLAEVLVELFAIFVIAIILISFWYLMVFSPKEKIKRGIVEVTNKQEKLTLLDLLKTSIRYDFDNDLVLDDGNIADLIVYSYKKGNYDDFKKITEEKIGLLFDGTKCSFYLGIFEDDKLIVSMGSLSFKTSVQTANAIIPIAEKKFLYINYEDDLSDYRSGGC
ncbi:hypothetical protein HYX18_03350 [Candidatus Woesearchaeota archaeon]|nr:hypothetical protein [Candidatus Woesearchaeota archaeon]